MTGEMVLAAVDHYRARFNAAGIKREKHATEQPMKSPELGLAHCHWMLDGIVQFVHEGRLDKAQRWLCFVQGLLWSNLYYTSDDLHEHNRPLNKE